MRIEAATSADVRYVAERMRDTDLREFLAVSRARDRWDLAESLVERYGGHPDVLAARLDGSGPVAIGAMIEARPNVITLFFFATDNFPIVAVAMTRFIRQRLFPRYRAAGVHRIECVSIEGHDDAHRWIEILGLRREATMPGFGRDGETFFQFAWVSDGDVRPTGA